ncbi:MAG: PsiF family protein [Rubrivivax sp.]
MNKPIALAALTLSLFAGHAFAADCAAQADEKKLAGAARTSFIKKCEKDAAAAPSAACVAQADEKKLAGAARNSFVKKCTADEKKAKK